MPGAESGGLAEILLGFEYTVSLFGMIYVNSLP